MKMGFWPFGGGKRQQAVDSNQHAREKSLQSDPSEKMGRLEKASTDLSGNSKDSTKGFTKKDESNKARRLSKIRLSTAEQQQRSQTGPVAVPGPRQHNQLARSPPKKDLYHQNPTSQSSLGPENFSVVRQPPTLHARRSEQDQNVARRKSSKRKAEDHARERVVRAMSSSPVPIPRRPTSFQNTGPLQRETRDIPGALNRKLNRPSSQVSLPLPEPLPGIDDLSHQHSFKISMFAALSPRPTIKYDASPRSMRGKQPQRPIPLLKSPTVEEEEDADKKRIDDLADDLDAGGLRELMERDKKRRERKKKQDQARLQRRLQRRADKQQEEEARQARTEEYVSASASQVRGLDIDPSDTRATIQKELQPGLSERTIPDVTDPFADSKSRIASPLAIRNPFDDEKDMDVMQDQGSDMEPEPAIPVKSPLRKAVVDVAKQDQQPSEATPASPIPRVEDRQSISQGSILNRELTGDIPENASLTGAASDHSSQRLNSWTTFFSRGTRRKLSSSFQGRSTPSEFSNTSRESFARKQQPPVITARTFRRANSAIPQRTMSKFREDLPEFPISPPDSRMQSPEVTSPIAMAPYNEAVTDEGPREVLMDETEGSAYTGSSPIPVKDNRRDNKPSMDLEVPSGEKPEMMLSQSLASVDSEASWLSGKPLGRRSGASQKLQARRSSMTRHMPGAFDGGNDVLASVLASPESPVPKKLVAGASTEDVAEDEKWHAGLGRQPTLIRQTPRAKSKEGLLNEYTADEEHDSSAESSDDSPEMEQEEFEPKVTMMRARSVEYKGHVRHMSAGSARLLDIKRSSGYSGDIALQPQAPASQDRVSSQPATNELIESS